MKTLKLLSIFALAILFSHCGTTESITNSQTPSLSEVTRLLISTKNKFNEYNALSGNTPYTAIEQTNIWVQTQPEVTSAYTVDSILIYITLRSGLSATFSYNEVDSDGYSLYRGGGSSSGNKLLPFHKNSKNTIQNLNVLIFASAYSDFYRHGEIEKILNTFQSSGKQFTVTLLKDRECTYDIIDKFGSYGLVIIDAHGLMDGFLIGNQLDTSGSNDDESIKQKIIRDAGQKAYEMVLSGDIRLGMKNSLDDVAMYITTKYLNTLPQMPSTVIMGNMCYSGQSVVYKNMIPIQTVFLSKNPISYYCYTKDNGWSNPVSDEFAKSMEDSLVRSLTIDNDSTGSANLQSNRTEFVDYNIYKSSYKQVILKLKHFGADDYSYNDCIDTFTDARDGQKYKAVCIGDQTWMAENLRYDAVESQCYDSLDENCYTFGRLYPWVVAMRGAAATDANPSNVQGICPNGWHIPSEAEWNKLFTTLGADTAARALKLRSSLWKNWAGETNSSGFSAVPGGYFRHNGIQGATHPEYDKKGEWALFLSTSVANGKVKGISLQSQSSKIIPMSITNEVDPNQPTMNASCRCVKD